MKKLFAVAIAVYTITPLILPAHAENSSTPKAIFYAYDSQQRMVILFDQGKGCHPNQISATRATDKPHHIDVGCARSDGRGHILADWGHGDYEVYPILDFTAIDDD